MTAAPAAPDLRVIRSAERDRWRDAAVDSRQSFPATGAFDLAAGAYGSLLIHNDDVVGPGEGFEIHDHAGVEIVTWVLEGRVRHTDRAGHAGELGPGQAQRISAGRGISHTEHNAHGPLTREKLRVVQMWIAPDTAGGEPSYAQADFTDALATGEPVTVASGLDRDTDSGALTIGNSHVALHIARPAPGQTVALPGAPFGHLYVATGTVSAHAAGSADTEAVVLEAGDVLRATGTGPITVVADAGGDDRAEIIYWEMHAGVTS